MMVNATMGSGGAAMITSRETHVFVRQKSIFPLRHTKGSSEKVSDGGVGMENTIHIPTERTCECPGSKEGGEGLLPTFSTTGDETDESSAEWKVTVIIKRKGLLKRDVK